MPRTTSRDFQELVSRVGYGVESSLKRATNVEARNTGEINNLERNFSNELEGPEKLQVGSSSKVVVRFKFYRHRLADYSRAISEKALIDSLQYAGLIPGDSEKEVFLIDEGQCKVETKAEERTELVLEYQDVDYENPWVPAKVNKGR